MQILKPRIFACWRSRWLIAGPWFKLVTSNVYNVREFLTIAPSLAIKFALDVVLLTGMPTILGLKRARFFIGFRERKERLILFPK